MASRGYPLSPIPLRIDWTRVATRWLPFADAASATLPLSRLLRLALFQTSVGMVTVLLVGTLNRVMIVEIGVAASLVAVMIALPLLVAPFRALIGLRSDLHRSALGWRRVPFIWFGTLAQFGGLAIMPFALILLGGETTLQLWAGHLAAALAFLLVGVGMQTVQTAGLALATDLATEATRPRVVALMYVMLLVGMLLAGVVFSVLLVDYTPTRLVQVVQGAAVTTVLLNAVAMWKQEARDRTRRERPAEPTNLRARWRDLAAAGPVHRFLLAVGLGTAAFNMQDVILEPYGGEVLGLSVGQTTLLTGLMAAGAMAAFALSARHLTRGAEPHRLAAAGVVVGLFAFACVIFAEPMQAPWLFRLGVVAIGFGGGLFAVGTLTAAMSIHGSASRGLHGMVLGAWGGVVALAAGLSVALGGVLRDIVSGWAASGALGDVLSSPGVGYTAVYQIELLLLFATLVVIGPLTRRQKLAPTAAAQPERFGLAEFPN